VRGRFDVRNKVESFFRYLEEGMMIFHNRPSARSPYRE
jgi:hypothetical protein